MIRKKQIASAGICMLAVITGCIIIGRITAKSFINNIISTEKKYLAEA